MVNGPLAAPSWPLILQNFTLSTKARDLCRCARRSPSGCQGLLKTTTIGGLAGRFGGFAQSSENPLLSNDAVSKSVFNGCADGPNVVLTAGLITQHLGNGLQNLLLLRVLVVRRFSSNLHNRP